MHLLRKLSTNGKNLLFDLFLIILFSAGTLNFQSKQSKTEKKLMAVIKTFRNKTAGFKHMH